MFGAILALAGALIVIDGDTVRDPATRERLRLEEIDAPERGARARCSRERRLAEEATERLREIVRRGVTVEPSGRRDRYRRPLVTLRTRDGRSAGAILLEEGLAAEWRGRRAEWCAVTIP